MAHRCCRDCGAEGVLCRDTLFLVFLQGIFDFLGNFASPAFRTVRTNRTLRTQLYLSCSELVPPVWILIFALRGSSVLVAESLARQGGSQPTITNRVGLRH